MDRYLIIAPHSIGDCQKVLKQIEATGYITHFDWGCMDNEHCGWVIIEADNPQEALMVVPSFNRHNARAIKLTKFSPEKLKSSHQS
jgi:hypothetical protein